MSKKTVVIGFLGSQLDAGQGAGRWEKWRPTVSLVQHQDTLVHRLELLHVPKHEALAKAVQRDIAAVSPETEVRLVSMDIADPWDFGEVYGVVGYSGYWLHRTRANNCMHFVTRRQLFRGMVA